MSSENKALVRAFFNSLNRDHIIPEEFVGHGFRYHVAGAPPISLEASQQRMAMFHSAFPDLTHTEQDLLSESDRVAFRSSLEMTHGGEFMGVPPTKHHVSVVEMGMMRIADRKIVEMWGLIDMVGIMQQIGALPSPG
jgi:predicted ester cyclase